MKDFNVKKFLPTYDMRSGLIPLRRLLCLTEYFDEGEKFILFFILGESTLSSIYFYNKPKLTYQLTRTGCSNLAALTHTLFAGQ